jgi:hypothetical protein
MTILATGRCGVLTIQLEANSRKAPGLLPGR